MAAAKGGETTVNSYTLHQIGDDENGDFYLNSGQDPTALIDAGKELAKKYPGTDYTVTHGKEILWSSRKLDASFRLMRRVRDFSILIRPGSDPDALIVAGENMAKSNPDLTLEVEGPEGIIWTNKKDASSGEAGSASENG